MNFFANFFGHIHNLEDACSSEVTCTSAFLASPSDRYLVIFHLFIVESENKAFILGQIIFFLAVNADRPHQPLCNYTDECRIDEERLNPKVHETGDGA